MAVKPKPAASTRGAKPRISVNMEGVSEKKHSFKYWTDAASQPFNNLYVSKEAIEKLGNPQTLKVTIEPGD